jgi:hypothetical protein
MESYEHDNCEMEEITEKLSIQCKNCIDKTKDLRTGWSNCKCGDKYVKKMRCKICSRIKIRINSLQYTLDETLYFIAYDAKNFIDCEDNINKLHELSKELRQCNRILCERKKLC